jgi:hypothetical protein
LGILVSASLLLSDYFVRDYVTEEKVAELRSGSHSASSYFDTYLHRYTVQATDVPKSADPRMTKTYRETTAFPYEYLVDFFDEALLVTLLPDTRRIDFLLISLVPDNKAQIQW